MLDFHTYRVFSNPLDLAGTVWLKCNVFVSIQYIWKVLQFSFKMGTEAANEVLQTFENKTSKKTEVFYSYLECHSIISFYLARSSLFSQTFMKTEHPKGGEALLSSQHSTQPSARGRKKKHFRVAFIPMLWEVGLYFPGIHFWFRHLFSLLQ